MVGKTKEHIMEEDSSERKLYQKPEITHELDLETQAGSPLFRAPDPLNLPGSGE